MELPPAHSWPGPPTCVMPTPGPATSTTTTPTLTHRFVASSRSPSELYSSRSRPLSRSHARSRSLPQSQPQSSLSLLYSLGLLSHSPPRFTTTTTTTTTTATAPPTDDCDSSSSSYSYSGSDHDSATDVGVDVGVGMEATLEYAFPAFSQSRSLIIKPHRRDQFIEWIKGLLAVPFVLLANRASEMADGGGEALVREAHERYTEIMRHVEGLVSDHISRQNKNKAHTSQLAQEVSNIGPFFTSLPLEAAFKLQDERRRMSSRRCIPPSFHDIRLMLNSAQLMALANHGLCLATFDGDMTLYDDGQSLEPSNPVLERILVLLRNNICIGIVTAAGYPTAAQYYTRLHGLLDAVATSPLLTPAQRTNLVVMGGEANYLFVFDHTSPHRLQLVPRDLWMTPEMAAWSEPEIASLLDAAEAALRERVAALAMPATILRKERAVGIIPDGPGVRILPESLEETVLAVERVLMRVGSPAQGLGTATPAVGVDAAAAPAKGAISFCAFNGGRDVFVDIGDKSWGVRVCQDWFGRRDGVEIRGENTLHVGDQFLSAGSNDYKARTVSTTAWIASPEETVELLDELVGLVGGGGEEKGEGDGVA